MSLRYDFDIQAIVGTEQFRSDDSHKTPTDFGVQFQQAGAKVALFRDPETATALAHAPATLRQIFMDAGFGLNSHYSGLPEGFYPESDSDVRDYILAQLQQKLAHKLPSDHRAGEFSLVGFLDSVAGSRPISDKASTRYFRALQKKARPVWDFDRSMFTTKIFGTAILAFITSRYLL